MEDLNQQLMIFNDESDGECDTADMTPSKVELDVNGLRAQYEELMSKIRDLHRRFEEEQEKVLGYTVVSGPTLPSLREFSNGAIDILIRKAQTEFTNTSAKIDIKREQMLDKFGFKRFDKLEQIDLNQFWKMLTDAYGGDAGRKIFYQQKASYLARYCGLDREEKIKTTSKSTVLTLKAYATARWGAKGYHYENKDWFVRLLEAFLSFVEWGKLESEKKGLEELVKRFSPWYVDFELREKIIMGSIQFVLFKNKIEIHFSHQTTQKLQLFLSEFASE